MEYSRSTEVVTSVEDKRRILTIDGGGLKGMVPAALLAELETHIGKHRLHEYFDLIVGTSTGGIIAAGLAFGLTAKEIVRFYRESGPRIFPALTHFSRRWLGLAGWVRAKFEISVLREELTKCFKQQTIGEAATRLVIPSWDRTAQHVYVWKTRHCGRFRTDYKQPIVEALLATAAAPSYFSSSRKHGGAGLIDGGVWANNPMLIAAVEAVGVLQWKREHVHMLALGCVREDNIAPERGGKLQWAFRAPDLFLQAQSSGAREGACLLLGERSTRPQRVLRLEGSAPEGYFSLDGQDGLDEMEAIGRFLARKHLQELRETYFDRPAAPFIALPDDATDTAIS